MKKLTLKRHGFSFGAFSTLLDEQGHELCKMAERPWQNNLAGISCVPVGRYQLLPHNSPKFGQCYALEAPELGVTLHGPSLRTHILIHPANLPSQLAGCLAPGTDFGCVDGQWAVVNSKTAFNTLMTYLDGQAAQLEITHG